MTCDSYGHISICKKINFATKNFLELLGFQGSWNLIGQEKIGYPDQNFNAVVHSQTGKQRNDLADRKQAFHRTTILHTGPIKQAVADCC